MSQVRLTLRPPPNVDFVHGYPGIPPGSDRPQAALKGALEVRAAPSVKAKWVRIELRKVEMLPGAGPNNTYYDFVGPSPVNLWVANEGEEYSDLTSLDFPFSIRIPESIPPSLALENRAGVKYELLASVCIKGKRGFLRRKKSTVLTTQSPIIIDKHELHSTWPVYCQPEARLIESEGVTLTVERNHTCYGPGDKISVWAAVKSDKMHTVILRGFEFCLKESMVFRPGRAAPGSAFGGGNKKNSPQVMVTVLSENKFPINATLYGGQSTTSELFLQLSPNHTTTTLNSARHIDITYVLSVKALMGTGTHLVMDLPVVVSNWQRTVSQEAVRRIGPAPSLSLLPPNATSSNANPMSVVPVAASSASGTRSQTLPTHTRNVSLTNNLNNSSGSLPNPTRHRANGSLDEFGRSTTNNSRPSSPNNSIQQVSKTTGANANSKWLNAETEKQLLFERARQQAEITQGLAREALERQAKETSGATSTSSAPARSASPPPPTNSKSTAAATTTTKANGPKWPTAEQEKLKLYSEAQAAAKKAQGVDVYSLASPPGTDSPPSSAPSQPSGGGSSSAAAAATPSTPPPPISEMKLTPNRRENIPGYRNAEQEKLALKRYYEAKQAVDRSAAQLSLDGDDSSGGANAGPAPVNGLSGPVAYNELYPSSSPPPPSNSLNEAPPAFDDTVASPVKDAKTALDEKMRMKKLYEERDRLAAQAPPAAVQPALYSPPQAGGVKDARTALEEKLALKKMYAQQDQQQQEVPAYSPPAQSPGASMSAFHSAAAEKERLRRVFEKQDRERAQTQQVTRTQEQSSLPRTGSTGSTRARPTPPVVPGAKVLTAAEEKAMLKARYESDDRRTTPKTNGASSPPATTTTFNGVNGSASDVLSPPPLLPRPPVSYIQETQEEDARVSKYAIEGVLPPDEAYTHLRSPTGSLRK